MLPDEEEDDNEDEALLVLLVLLVEGESVKDRCSKVRGSTDVCDCWIASN